MLINELKLVNFFVFLCNFVVACIQMSSSSGVFVDMSTRKCCVASRVDMQSILNVLAINIHSLSFFILIVLFFTNELKYSSVTLPLFYHR